MLEKTLLANGVKPEQIEVIPDEEVAVDRILQMARPGDLLLIFGDAISRTWKQVVNFRPESAAPAERAVRPALTEPPPMTEPLPTDYESLVRDERGVRIAREPEAED